MCSTICPRKRARCFKIFLTEHVCNAPTSSFHQNLFFLELVTVAQRSKSSKCARLSAPEKGPAASVFFSSKHIYDAPPCSFHQNLFLIESVIVAHTSKSSKCARLSTREKGPIVSDFFQPSIFVMPQPLAFTKACFSSNWSLWLRIPSPPSVLDYPPKKRARCFTAFSTKQILMAQLVAFTRTCFWSTWSQCLRDLSPLRVLDYPPQKRGHCFTFFSPKHICDAPFCSFHHNLLLVEVVTVAQRSKSSKCARLSAPEKRADCFRFFFQPSTFVMPQPVAFTRTGF